MSDFITLEQFVDEEQTKDIILAVAKAGSELSNFIRDPYNDFEGLAGMINIHEEDVTKLDLVADNIVTEMLFHTKKCAALASEERHEIVLDFNDGEYILVHDPLDGSSNIDINGGIGTIFAIYKRETQKGSPATDSDCMQQGTKQLAAGYILYGPRTMLTLTTGSGVNSFTLDTKKKVFFLTHKDIKIPQSGKIVSINYGYRDTWSEELTNWYDKFIEKDGMKGRYVGAAVSDLHRTLIKGGVFLYPRDETKGKGKLRLVYECNPISFIVEQAGGSAITQELDRVLELNPSELHQRISFVFGSKDDVENFRSFHE